MREETSTINVHSCRTTMSSASLQRFQWKLHTFFEIMSSLATDLVAGAVDMAADGCREARNYSLAHKWPDKLGTIHDVCFSGSSARGYFRRTNGAISI